MYIQCSLEPNIDSQDAKVKLQLFDTNVANSATWRNIRYSIALTSEQYSEYSTANLGSRLTPD